jgi:hypothetical protein
MISTEVQRTLVKSPPELWAELSDPASLARHLGELGEIRITRIEPEETVEWEAESASGTVQIKQSGWGTRVTLTVTRAVPGAEEPRAGDASEDAPSPGAAAAGCESTDATASVEPSAHAAAHEPEPPGAAEQVAPPQAAEAAAPFAAEQAAPPQAAEAPAPAEAPRPAMPEAPLESGKVVQWRPQTAAGAARTHAWRVADASPESHCEPDLPDAYDEAPIEDSEPPATLAAHEEQPESRRGFLARLFGRRSRRAAGDSQGWDHEDHALGADERLEGIDAEVRDLGMASEPGAADTPDTVEPVATPGDPDGTGAAAAAQAPESVELTNAATEALGAEQESDPPPETEMPTAREPVGAVPDISSELKAAEEAATAEMTAVLTAVLDRLGSAHHRPFSRG